MKDWESNPSLRRRVTEVCEGARLRESANPKTDQRVGGGSIA